MASDEGLMASVDVLTAPFFNHPQYSDIIIKFGECEVHAHKVILAQQSGYFARAFFGLFQVTSHNQYNKEYLTDTIRLRRAMSSIWVTKTTLSCSQVRSSTCIAVDG
jgi:hypothetical protein